MSDEEPILRRHWERISRHYREQLALPFFSRSYRRILARYIGHIVPQKARVLELGCGAGHLLAALPGRERMGVDLVPEQLEAARKICPEATFAEGVAETFMPQTRFDYVLLSDLLNEAADVQRVLENVRSYSDSDTRLVINIYNTLWRPVLGLARMLGLKPRRPELNWLSRHDLLNLLDIAGWEVVRSDTRMLAPHGLLGIGSLVNRLLAPFLPWCCLSLFFVARLKRAPRDPSEFTASVIIPARNESGNIRAAVERVPDMGASTEIIFVEGNSQDETWDTIQQVIREFPGKRIRAFQQDGKGKGNAMRKGYAEASGDIFLILDADLTVPPEDLPKFFQAIASGSTDFANGVRLVYPMEDQAMRFLNMCGNKFFSLLFSWLLGQPIKDTLCGTKVFRRTDYAKIEANRAYFGDFDPFGDFDLIFGASHLNLKIRDIPVRYQAREYGATQISRWSDGMLLFRMAWVAANKIKFL
jgi:SAM-dependent methyltransferase